MARATQLCLCSFCWFKTLFSFPLGNGWAKPRAARLLRRAGVRSALPGPNSTPDNSIEALASIGHRYLRFLSAAAAPCYRAAADFLCPRPGSVSRWGCDVPSQPFALLPGVTRKRSKLWKVLWIPLLKFTSSNVIVFLCYGEKSYFKKLSCCFCSSVFHFHGYMSGTRQPALSIPATHWLPSEQWKAAEVVRILHLKITR